MVEDELKPVEPAAELAPEGEPELAEAPRAKSPWKAFILTGFLAGLIGAIGGAYGAYAGLKKYAPAPVAQVETDLSPIEAKLQRLTDRVSAAETEVEALASRPVVEADPVMAAPVDLTGLEDRLTALETAPSPEVDPEALKALQAAQADGFEWPETDQIEAVLSQLDERLSAIEADVNAGGTEVSKDEALSQEERDLANEETRAALQDLSQRVGSLETGPDKLQDIVTRLEALENRPLPTPVVERVSILAFPKAQMIEAVEANMEGGVIKKTLSRHIRVKDTDDPLTLIDGIESDLSEGRLADAADKFERLPAPVRAKGQAWYESVKASL